MVNPDDAKKAFETYLSQGDDVVYFSISAGISGSWWSAKLAGDELMEEYPGRRVCPIDSMGASLGAGIPALKASSLVRQEMCIRDSPGILRILQFLPEFLPHGGGDPERGGGPSGLFQGSGGYLSLIHI